MRILRSAFTSLSVPLVCASIALSASITPAAAQSAASMPGMSMSPSVSGASNSSQSSGPSHPSTQAFKDADQKMMKDMNSPTYMGDADRDFVAHMIPHHQGAIDMAKVELKYGKDPMMRRLAAKIVQAQQREIRLMQLWQKKHSE